MKKTRKMKGKRICSMMLVLVMVIALITGVDVTKLHAEGAVQYEPIEISESSLNGNAIWGVNEAWSSNITLDKCAAFYAQNSNRNNGVGGLPVNGKLTTNNGITYQLATGGAAETAYDGNDCIWLHANSQAVTMNLQTIGVYENIYVLATAGGPSGSNYAKFRVTLNYTDDSYTTTTYRLYDWYCTVDVEGVEKYYPIMRIEGVNFYTGTTYGGPILQSATIEANREKLLESIKFELLGINETGSIPGNLFCGIFAVTGATPSGVPAAPVATAATKVEGVSSGVFTANWEAVDGATGYRLDVARDRKFTDILDSYNNKDVGSVTSFEVSEGINADTVYYYRVRAVNEQGQSLGSNRICTDLPVWIKNAIEDDDYDKVSYDAENNKVTFGDDVTLKDTIVLPEEDTTVIDVGSNTVTAPEGKPALSAGSGSNVGLSVVGSDGSGGIAGNGCDAEGNGVPTIDFSNASGNSTIDLENTSVTGSSGSDTESESGNGGQGGAGIKASSNTKIEVGAGTVVSGGDGGNASSGNGGNGGAGISGGNVVLVDSTGTVNGGDGGNSKNGDGGNGGQGISDSGSPSNSGNVSGGDGGNSQNGNGGDGGQGISGSGNPSNSGNVSGGNGGNGTTPGTGGNPGASGGTTGQPGIAHTHVWTEAWTTNSTHHWHMCIGDGTCSITNDDEKNGYGEHIYDNGSDATCNICGYTRTVASEPQPSPESGTSQGSDSNNSDSTPSQTVTPTATPSTPNNITNNTDTTENAQGALLDESGSQLAESVLTPAEQARVASGENVKIWLEATEIQATEVQATDEDQILITTAMNTSLPGYSVGMYLDFTLWKQFNNEEPVQIHTTTEAVTIKFRVPNPLINTDASVVRTYQIIRVHEGVTDVLPCSYDPVSQTISFETDRFSCYALVYTDTVSGSVNQNPGQLDDVPKTGDTGSTPIWFTLMLFSGLGVVFVQKKAIRRR